MNIPRELLQNLTLEAQMNLSATSRAHHRRQVDNCMPIGYHYRDKASTSAIACLPHGVVNAEHRECCEYNNGIRFFALLLRIFNASFHGLPHVNPRLKKLHRWLVRKYGYTANRPTRLLISNEQYRYVNEWLILLAPQRNRPLIWQQAYYRKMRLGLQSGGLGDNERQNLSHFIEHYMLYEDPLIGVICSCENNFDTNFAIQHLMRHSLTSNHDQYVQLLCNNENTYISDCFDVLFAAPGRVLDTRNTYVFLSQIGIAGINTGMTVNDVTQKIDNWIDQHVNQGIGNRLFSIKVELECLHDYRNSTWMNVPFMAPNYEIRVEGQHWILSRDTPFLVVNITCFPAAMIPWFEIGIIGLEF